MGAAPDGRGRDHAREPLAALQEIEAAREHPLGFWLAVGFTVVGVFPDAEGLGKPTILLARRSDVGCGVEEAWLDEAERRQREAADDPDAFEDWLDAPGARSWTLVRWPNSREREP